ncbi:hypothetical protein L345_10733, partial [Ophiophagus hannah]
MVNSAPGSHANKIIFRRANSFKEFKKSLWKMPVVSIAIVKAPAEYNTYNKGATVSEIKKQYRLLSLKYHPDKGGDEVMFMNIAKAYAALTDEESRKNWEEYGSPDGPQATSFGIALPAWIVDQKNSIL